MISLSTPFKAVILLLVGAMGLLVVMNPPVAVAQSNQEKILGQLCEGDARDNFDANCDSDAAEAQTKGIFRRVVRTALWVVGIVSVTTVIIGGMMYVFSSGGPEQTARARNTIIYALIGLAVAFLGIFLLEFVINQTATNNPTIDDPPQSQSDPVRGGTQE